MSQPKLTIINLPSSGGFSAIQTDPDTNAVLATGVIMPRYVGVGDPSATTLAAGAYFSLYCEWLDVADPLAPNLWICVTAGDKVTSVWYSFTKCP